MPQPLSKRTGDESIGGTCLWFSVFNSLGSGAAFEKLIELEFPFPLDDASGVKMTMSAVCITLVGLAWPCFQ